MLSQTNFLAHKISSQQRSQNFTSCVIYKRKHINDLFKKTLKGDDDAEIDNL